MKSKEIDLAMFQTSITYRGILKGKGSKADEILKNCFKNM
jgi:hypothetical protein